MSFVAHWSRCCYGTRILFWSGCTLWAKTLSRNRGAHPIFEMAILVPPSRHRPTALAFPRSRAPSGRQRGRPDVTPVLCQTWQVSLHTDCGVTSREACLLEQTDWKFKTPTNLLQNKENKFQHHLKKPKLLLYWKKPHLYRTKQFSLQYCLPCNVMCRETL